MADEKENVNPIETIRERAMELFPDDADERDDYIAGRMARAGFKKGPGEWISAEDAEDEPQDDDDEPVTRGEYRRIQRERARQAAAKSSQAPPKKEATGEGKKPPKGNSGATANKWWS